MKSQDQENEVLLWAPVEQEGAMQKRENSMLLLLPRLRRGSFVLPLDPGRKKARCCPQPHEEQTTMGWDGVHGVSYSISGKQGRF